jgi:hypothetical protein
LKIRSISIDSEALKPRSFFFDSKNNLTIKNKQPEQGASKQQTDFASKELCARTLYTSRKILRAFFALDELPAPP